MEGMINRCACGSPLRLPDMRLFEGVESIVVPCDKCRRQHHYKLHRSGLVYGLVATELPTFTVPTEPPRCATCKHVDFDNGRVDRSWCHYWDHPTCDEDYCSRHEAKE